MTWVARLHARQAGRNQEGFALATTIAILLVTSMLITAMLGLTFATSTYAGDQVRRDRESRAAESGMDPAAALLARSFPPCGDPAGPVCANSPTLRGVLRGQVYDKSVLGGIGYDDACGWTPNTANNESEASRPALIDTDTDDKHVQVFCTALPAERFAPESRTDSVVKLIGKLATGDPAVTRWSSTTNTPCQPLSTPAAAPLVTGGPSLNAPECLPWAEAFSAAGMTSQAGAVAASFTSATSSRNGTSLVHSGPDALQVVGDMDVSGGAAVLRNGDRGVSNSFVSTTPAMALSGAYRQGDPGPLPVGPAVAAGVSGNSARCGILGSNSGAAYTLPSAQISAGADPICDQPNLRSDVVTNPSLLATVPAATPWTPDRIRANDRTAAQLPLANGVAVPSWNSRFTPAIDCPVAPGGSIKFSPGAYPANLTARLNAWFAACSGVKFWFAPSGGATGYYWMDVSETVGGVPSTALRMDKTSNIWVFGTPSSDISVISKDNRPLCNPAAAGVNVTLSPRTVFRHKGGYVGICGDLTNAARQAIWQDPTANLGFEQVVPTLVQGGTSSTPWYQGVFLIGSVLQLLFGGQLGNTFNYTPTNNWGGFTATTTCQSAPCNGTVGFTTTWAPPAGSDPGRATVTSAALRLTGDNIKGNDVWNGNIGATIVKLYKFNPGTNSVSTVPCTLTSPRMNGGGTGTPGGANSVDVDLFYPGSPCGSSMDRSELLKSRVDVVVGVNSECDLLAIFTGCVYGVNFSAVKLVMPQTLASPANAAPSVISGASAGASAVSVVEPGPLAGGTLSFNFNRTCSFSIFFCLSWSIPGSGSTTVRLPSVSDRYEPAIADTTPTAAGSPLTSAVLKVRGVSSCSNNLLNVSFPFYSRRNCSDIGAATANGSTMIASVKRNGVEFCKATFNRLPEWNQTRGYDLLNTCVNSSGQKKLVYNRDLIGTDVDVTFNFVRDGATVPGYGCNPSIAGLFCSRWGYTLDHIGIVTTVSPQNNQAFDGPSDPFVITSNDYAGAQREGRFNVNGAVILPRANVRVEWIGPANQAGTPIFNGPPATGSRTTELMAASLYSYQSPAPGQNQAISSDDPQTGIICCAAAQPAERLVELRSHVVPNDRFKLPTAETVNYTSQSGVTGPVKDPATGAPLTVAETQLENSTDCKYDRPQDLPLPPKVLAAVNGASVVDGRAIRAAWVAKVVRDWNQTCRVKTLRAVSKVRVLDQIPPDIDPATVTAAIYAKRGSWFPGWDFEVQDFKFCQGGSNGTTVCGDQ